MIEQEDIQKIIKAHQEIFATKEDLENFRGEMQEYYSDIQSAEKLGMKLEY